MSVEELSNDLFKNASSMTSDEIINGVVKLLNVSNINISKSDVEHLLKDDDWDDAAQTFHELILPDMKPLLNFQVCYKIDRALSYVNSKVKPGGFWWRAYGYPAAKNLKVGHGLFTFDGSLGSLDP